MPQPVVDLDALIQDRLIRVNGAQHIVRPANAIATKLAASMTDENRIDVMLQICAMVVPSMTEEQLGALAITQLDKILEVSASGLTVVQDADPNASGPAATEPTTPA